MLTPLSGKKVLVTGGAGFLGRHVLPHLLALGAQVSCLVRSPRAHLPKEVTVILGDLRDGETVARAVQDQNIVIHMAGMLFGSHWEDYFAANGLMATNLASATQDSIERLIFVSSLAAAGPWASAPGRSEAEAPQPVSAYGWSKLLAEKILRSALHERLLILRPPIIYGSGDRGLLPLFRTCRHGLGISRPFSVSAIHASDVATAIGQLCSGGNYGLYHLSDGHIYPMDEFCMAMGRALGRERLHLTHVPPPALAVTARLSDWSHTLLGTLKNLLGAAPPSPPQWNWDKYRESVQCGWVADGTRLMQEGFRPQMTLDAGMAESVAFYRREGWL